MRYMMLLYGSEAEGDTPAAMSDETRRAWDAFREEVTRDGALVRWAGLESTATARTVRIRNGEVLVTDGPFAETREQLGGFFILDCPDLKRAREYAARMPCAPSASIEIRPVLAPAGAEE